MKFFQEIWAECGIHVLLNDLNIFTILRGNAWQDSP